MPINRSLPPLAQVGRPVKEDTQPQVKRLCQESKPHADVGWFLEFGEPDEFIPISAGHVLLRYGTVVVNMDAVTDGITYAEFQEYMRVRYADVVSKGEKK